MKTVIFKVHDCGCVETDDASIWDLVAIGRMVTKLLNEERYDSRIEQCSNLLSGVVLNMAPSQECVHVDRPQSN